MNIIHTIYDVYRVRPMTSSVRTGTSAVIKLKLGTHYPWTEASFWMSVDTGVVHAGRPRPWPHCVRWGPPPHPQRDTAPQFSAHICCGQMAVWIKMPLVWR